MIPHALWLVFVGLWAGHTLRCIYGGGRTLNDHLVAFAALGCFGVYAILGLGALEALDGLRLSFALGGLGVGAFLLYPVFEVLDGRRDPGLGPIWWLMLGGQPAYAFTFWAFLVLVPHSVWAICTGGPLGWPGPWLLPALFLALWGFIWSVGPGDRVERMAIRARGAEQDPLRIVQISDLHFGPDLHLSHLGRLLNRVRALEPQLVVITGDLFSPFSHDPGDHDGLAEALAGIPVPVAFCPGNHDMPRWGTLGPELRAAGVLVLDDQRTTLVLGRSLVELLGAGFRWSGLAEATEALLREHPSPEEPCYRVLLCHDPRVATHLPPGRVHLSLAGHTHGGAPALNMFGLGVSLMRPLGVLDQGLFQLSGGPLYVHRGSWIIGLPPRLGNGPEIAVFDLSSEPG